MNNQLLSCMSDSEKVGPFEKFHAEGAILKTVSGVYISDDSNLIVDGNIVSKKLISSKHPTTYSDRSIKTNFSDIEDSINIIKNLYPCIYDMKDGSETHQYGFIAQEVESVLPSLVETDAKGLKTVSYVELIPILCKAMKEILRKLE